jgi:hypothetical protein
MHGHIFRILYITLFCQSLSVSLPLKSHENVMSNEYITILGFGSLLSERSSRTTFPDLRNFRLGRVKDYRRIFGHPASIFFQRGKVENSLVFLSPSALSYVYFQNSKALRT